MDSGLYFVTEGFFGYKVIDGALEFGKIGQAGVVIAG